VLSNGQVAAEASEVKHAAAALSSPDSEPILSARLHHPSDTTVGMHLLGAYTCDLGPVRLQANRSRTGRTPPSLFLVHYN